MKTPYRNVLSISFLFMAVLLSCKPDAPRPEATPGFEKTFIDTHDGYSEAVAFVSGGLKTIYVSGQVGEGPDLDSQMRSALSNLKEVLGKAGATMDDVVKMNTYIVDYGPQSLETFRGVRRELLGDTEMPASTLVGVESLALPEWLIEIEAIAVMPVTE
ncbi:MAG: RidA family protein [Robiginitalea sp.]|nr:RidA family protein [Robiginitalea sp.]